MQVPSLELCLDFFSSPFSLPPRSRGFGSLLPRGASLVERACMFAPRETLFWNVFSQCVCPSRLHGQRRVYVREANHFPQPRSCSTRTLKERACLRPRLGGFLFWPHVFLQCVCPFSLGRARPGVSTGRCPGGEPLSPAPVESCSVRPDSREPGEHGACCGAFDVGFPEAGGADPHGVPEIPPRVESGPGSYQMGSVRGVVQPPRPPKLTRGKPHLPS